MGLRNIHTDPFIYNLFLVASYLTYIPSINIMESRNIWKVGGASGNIGSELGNILRRHVWLVGIILYYDMIGN